MTAARRAIAIAVVALAACGSDDGRSLAAYCDTFWSGARELHATLDAQASDDPVAAVAAVFSSIGDLGVLFDEMARVAPDDIRADTEAIRDAVRSLPGSGGSGDIVSAIVSGLTSAGSFDRVNAYLRDNCPPPSDLVAAEPAGESTGTEVALDGEARFTDEDDYLYEASFTVSLGNVRVETADEPPGRARVVVTTSGSIQVRNGTTGHNLPAFEPEFALLGFYAADRPICDFDSVDVAGIDSVELTEPASGPYCVLLLGSADLDVTGLAPGDSTEGAIEPSGYTLDASSTGPGERLLRTDEAHADDLAGDITTAPDFVSFAFQSSGTGDCRVSYGFPTAYTYVALATSVEGEAHTFVCD